MKHTSASSEHATIGDRIPRSSIAVVDRRAKVSTHRLRYHVQGRAIVKGSDQTDDGAEVCGVFFFERD